MEDVLQHVYERDAAQPEFHQAVTEVFESLRPLLDRQPRYQQHRILERMVEPDRIMIFRVGWMDDRGRVHYNRGYRVQFNNALGPYKGGLRFHPTVYLGLMKFLGFEQVFKNALTTLPLGGAKGGSDFDPKGKSDTEIMHFCQSFMTELCRYIGPDTDVPAGDIGVGVREIGYLFGQYKRLANEFNGTLTGKKPGWGGSLLRPEATGYGLIYFAEEMLATRGDSLQGKICTVSGAGSVAQHAAERIIRSGGKVVTMSDSGGMIHDPDGIDAEKLAWIMEHKNVERGRLSDYVERFRRATYHEGQRPWSVPCHCAFPCATQNELTGGDAAVLLKNGVQLVAEGANMPCTPEAVEAFLQAGILYAPGKAANAGGVAVSGLEMSQNAMHGSWTREEVEARLRSIMAEIHNNIRSTAEEYGKPGHYVLGANIAAFVKVADAMIDQGVV
ncbi:MAG: NADP-specific glutamate dehydrogenase [Candidatus Sumerlaeaceae bacterium]|nr:NADP-specific glutamate dehydrogenase [Candidatus Sumerlaeaceae bacterium]